MALNNYVGQRLSFEGHLCTIRYIGNVANTQGCWLGVEWDDPSRGKHSGAHKGVTYFECKSHNPTAGSFVRPQRPTDRVISVVEAIQEKYSSEVNALVEGDAIRISGKEVEEVGFEKIRRQFADLQELRVAVIDGLCIATSASLMHMCPKIRELDLSRNLFEDVNTVFEIAKQLPLLYSIKLDGNRLRSTALSINDLPSRPFTLLSYLSLDDTFLEWAEISAIASNFPALSVLSAGGNQLKALSSTALPLNLAEVRLERNCFQCLDDLRPLYGLPNLQTMVLKKNSLSSMMSGRHDTEQWSQSIKNIDLSHNEIVSWNIINELAVAFPYLGALKVSHNPLYPATSPDNGYLDIVARVASLTMLNYTQVTPKDRQTAEIFYLSKIGRALSAAPEAEASAIVAHHPRFTELCQIYGEPVVKRADTTHFHPDSLAAGMIRCKLELDRGVAPDRADTETVTELDIPRSFTVYNALGVIGKALGIQQTGLLELVSDDKILMPATRPLGTLLEGSTAKMLVRWDKERLWRCVPQSNS